MEETFEMAVDLVIKMFTEDRPPSQEEKELLGKMAAVVLFDIHSIAKNLERIANATEGMNMSAANGVSRDGRG